MISVKREEPVRSGESYRLKYEKKYLYKRLFASLQVLIYRGNVTGI